MTLKYIFVAKSRMCRIHISCPWGARACVCMCKRAMHVDLKVKGGSK